MRAVKEDDVPSNLEGAAMLEQRGDTKGAMALYEQLLKEFPSNLKILTRLMIGYRKLKLYKKEIAVINKAIKIYEQLYLPKKNKASVTTISKKLNLLLGHADKKGKSILLPPEVVKLQKRKEGLEKKYL
jgi:tetratricopeptide (TPR) repeat protein